MMRNHGGRSNEETRHRTHPLATSQPGPTLARRRPGLWRHVCAGFALLGTVAAPPTGAEAQAFSDSPTSTTSNPDWMASLPDTLRLGQISIPGTHNTMARQTKTSCFFRAPAFANCQSMPLQEQLNAGIRYLDLRWALSDAGKLELYHGAYATGDDFEDDVLEVVSQYLDDHERETVLIHLMPTACDCPVSGSACSTGSGDDALAAFAGAFERYAKHIYFPSSVNELPQLEQVRGKMVFLYRYFYLNNVAADVPSANGRLLALFPGSEEFDGYGPIINRFSEATLAPALDRIDHVAQQPRDEGTFFLTSVTGTRPPWPRNTPKDYAKFINPRVQDQLPLGTPPALLGTVMLDYPGGEIIEQILRANPQDDTPVEPPSIVGSYERQPVTSGWHRVEVVQGQGGALRWTNAANAGWSLHRQGGRLTTADDCPYGVQSVTPQVTLDANGAPQVVGLVFQGEVYRRMQTP